MPSGKRSPKAQKISDKIMGITKPKKSKKTSKEDFKDQQPTSISKPTLR